MAKKRGKRTKKKVFNKPKAAKKTIKSNFQEKKVSYSNVKKPVSPSKDLELDKELNELATHKYYGQKSTEKEAYGAEKKKVDKPVEKKIDKPKSLFHTKIYDQVDYDNKVPAWFYMASIFAAFLFTIYISIFATIHFGDIIYMNIMIVFLFISMVSFFLISTVYLISKRNKYHAIVPVLFFFGIVSIMIYAFKAVDTSDLVRFSIIYTIIVAAVSIYFLIIRK
ncbi:MAG: hypothetical protein IH934_05600 [Nanoarchaeota archaeon]|nr:hypothetical protein [Nanoarchaeota archaeon]